MKFANSFFFVSSLLSFEEIILFFILRSKYRISRSTLNEVVIELESERKLCVFSVFVVDNIEFHMLLNK